MAREPLQGLGQVAGGSPAWPCQTWAVLVGGSALGAVGLWAPSRVAPGATVWVFLWLSLQQVRKWGRGRGCEVSWLESRLLAVTLLASLGVLGEEAMGQAGGGAVPNAELPLGSRSPCPGFLRWAQPPLGTAWEASSLLPLAWAP